MACTDIDECLEGTDECDAQSSTCVNTEGGYTCVCKFGFNGTKEACPGTILLRVHFHWAKAIFFSDHFFVAA